MHCFWKIKRSRKKSMKQNISVLNNGKIQQDQDLEDVNEAKLCKYTRSASAFEVLIGGGRGGSGNGDGGGWSSTGWNTDFVGRRLQLSPQPARFPKHHQVQPPSAKPGVDSIRCGPNTKNKQTKCVINYHGCSSVVEHLFALCVCFPAL